MVAIIDYGAGNIKSVENAVRSLGAEAVLTKDKDVILSAVRTVLGANGIDIRSVAAVASIDVKKDEAGLLQAAEALNAELFFFSADELNAVPGDFEESAFVRKTVGTGNVCERAAVLAGGTRIINKTAVDGVTVAAAVKEMRIEF